MNYLPTNPALTQLSEYFTDTATRARQAQPDAPWLDLSIGDPEEPTPEFIRQALRNAVTPTLRYPTTSGQRELRAAIVSWLKRRHGVAADPEAHVLPCSGAKEAIFHLPFAFVDPASDRRRVIWGEPGYPIYGRGTAFASGIGHPVALTNEQQWRLELADEPESALTATALAWVNYPHNPTGACVDQDYFARQIATARAHQFVLASDECYQELWFESPAPSALEVAGDDFEGVVAIVSLSKRSAMTGYRSGAIVGDANIIAMLRRLRVSIGTASSTFVQAAAVAAWRDQAHVNQRRELFAAKRQIIEPFLRQAGYEVASSSGTFYIWFRTPIDDVEFAEQLADVHILISSGSSFGPAGRGWARLALVPTIDECARVVEVWSSAIADGTVAT